MALHALLFEEIEPRKLVSRQQNNRKIHPETSIPTQNKVPGIGMCYLATGEIYSDCKVFGFQ